MRRANSYLYIYIYIITNINRTSASITYLRDSIDPLPITVTVHNQVTLFGEVSLTEYVRVLTPVTGFIVHNNAAVVGNDERSRQR